MAANNSTLQIEVVSVGVQETVRRLDSLGNAAGRNEAKVKLLTDSLGKLMVAQSSAVSSAASHAATMNAVAQAMGLLANHATTTANQVALLNAHLNSLGLTAGNTTNAFNSASRSGGVLNATLRAMATAAAAYLGLNFAKGIVEAADGWIMMRAKLKLATGSMEDAKRVQGDLFDVSQRLRVPLDDIGKLYTRMAIPMQRMGKDAEQTANQVEFVALALKLNGATAGEASSVMLQYSQSVNAGRLNGAEFNAVAEGAPGILRAIEAELKATGQWSEAGGKSLKKMGADGEITFELMNRAAQRALPEMRKAFEELPLTVDGAIQRVKNAWFKAMGEMGEDTQMGKKLAQAIGQLEQDIPKIRDALAGVFIFLYDNFGKIVTVVEAIVLGKFIQWVAGAAMALPALVTALGAATTGMGAASGALGVMRVALTALTGPWGILIALVGTAAVAAWQYFGKEAPKADAVVTASTRVQTVNRIALIQKEIEKINERNAAATGAKAPAAYVVTASDREQVDLITKINGLKSAQQAVADKGAKAAYEPALAMLDAKLKNIQGQQAVLTALTKVNEDAVNGAKAAGIRAEIARKNETKPEEAKRKIAEWEEKLKAVGATMTEQEKMAVRLEVLGKNLGGPAPDKVNHYQKLTATIKATTAELELNIAAGEKASASEKVRAAINSGKNVDYNKLSAGQKAAVDMMLASNVALERQIELRDRVSKANIDAATESDKFNTKLQAGAMLITDETDRTRAQIAALTESKSAVKELAAAKAEDDALTAERLAIRAMDKNGDMVQYDLYMAQARALRELASAKRELGQGQDEKLGLDALDKLLDPKKALDFGDALGDAFGKAGEAIGKMSKALGSYGKIQEKIDDDRKLLMNITDEKKRTAGLEALDKKETQSKLRAYGDIAAGAKDLMSEHTAGYKIMAATEKAFRIAEMAMTIESTAMKVWGSLTAASAKGVETTAVVTGASVDAAATGGAIATSAARTSAYVMEGAAKMYAWLGPWGTVAVAGMLAVMAGLGFGGGGASATPIDFKDRQEKQHTGTVLGDDEAKSASIANALDMVADNSNIGLVLTSNMLSSLRGIEASMQGLAAAIFKVNGMTTGKNFGVTEGKSGGGVIDSIFGGATVTTIMDTGLKLEGTTDQFRNGQGAQQFVDVNKQKDGGWFKSDKSWNERRYMAANEEITKTVGRVFDSINSTIVDAATSLGANGDAIAESLDLFVVSTEVSFKDLKGDDLKQALEDMFSATADGMARSVFAGFESFQSAGEGYYETILRVATGSEQASNALETFGIQMVDVKSLTNKTGDIASEMVRQSIMAVESGTTMADIMKVMDGSLSDLIDGYKALLNIQDTMRGAGLGNSISRDTIRGAGGIAELESAMDEFIEGFYSDTEKQAISFSKLRAEFGRLNVAMPATKDGFKTLVGSLMAGNAASQELAGRVILLGGAFADAFVAAEEARKDAVDDATDLLSESYDKEADALENIIDKMRDFSESLADFKNTLITGDLSTKSTYEKYATAQSRYDDISTRAMAGDEGAIAEFEKAATELLKFSRDINASGVGYTADYDRVLLETEALRKFTSTQVDVATASLDALKEQVKGMLKLDESVLTVTAAVVALHTAMAGGAPAIDGSHFSGLSNVPFDGYVAELHKGEAVLTASENNEYRANIGNVGVKTDAAMVNELKALREELKQLREEQREQTSHMIAAGYDSNERNARTVVEGNKSAIEDASYLKRTKTGLV